MNYLIYTVTAIFISGIGAAYTRAIAKNHPLSAATLLSVMTFTSMTVFVTLIQNISKDGSYGVLAYAIGMGIGTYITLRYIKTKD